MNHVQPIVLLLSPRRRCVTVTNEAAAYGAAGTLLVTLMLIGTSWIVALVMTVVLLGFVTGAIPFPHVNWAQALTSVLGTGR